MLARPETTFQGVLDEYGVRLVPTHAQRGPRGTHAVRVLEKIYNRHQADHLRDVLACILESENNAMALIAPVISATSRLLLAHPKWWQRDASAWLEVYDATNLIKLHAEVKENQKAASVPAALATRIFELLVERFGEPEQETLL